MALRAVVIALCLPPLVFLSFQLRSVRLEESAVSAIEGARPSGSEFERAERLLDRAAKRNPTSEPELRKAQLLSFGGEPERALALLREIVADEPEHLPAWILLERAAEAAGEPASAEEARSRIAELNPMAGRPAR